MSVIIIGKDDCQLCKAAVDLSNAKNIPFEYKKINENLTLEDAFKLAGTPFRQFPAIIIDGKFIGGFNEYRRISLSLVE